MKGKKCRPLLIAPSFILGNGKVTKLDKLLHSRHTQEAYSRLIKKIKTDPEHAAEVLRATAWKGKSLDDMLLELG